MKTITVTELVRNFSEYINRITYKGERFIVMKGKKSVAEIGPTAKGRTLRELPEILKNLPKLSQEELDDFAKDLDKIREEANNAPSRDVWQ